VTGTTMYLTLSCFFFFSLSCDGLHMQEDLPLPPLSSCSRESSTRLHIAALSSNTELYLLVTNVAHFVAEHMLSSPAHTFLSIDNHA
jgi:hypothetical protein